jgi:hypothetical protein
VKIKRTLGTLALASTLVLTGCSDDGDGGDAESSDTSSETTTPTDEPTDEETDDSEEGEEVDLDEFLADFEEGVDATTTARMSMDMEAQGQAIDIEGDVDYTTEPVSMAMVMTGDAFGGQDIEMRIVDGTVYMNLGDASQGKFVQLSLEQLGAQAGFGNFTDQLDPGSQLETFREGLTKVEFVGDEDIEGVDTEHYTLTVDTTKLEESPPGAPETLELDVWLDDENRMTQMETDLGDMGTLTARMFDFGSDVEIEKPAASEIQKIPAA